MFPSKSGPVSPQYFVLRAVIENFSECLAWAAELEAALRSVGVEFGRRGSAGTAGLIRVLKCIREERRRFLKSASPAVCQKITVICQENSLGILPACAESPRGFALLFISYCLVARTPDERAVAQDFNLTMELGRTP
jgi:hypothetical protein